MRTNEEEEGGKMSGKTSDRDRTTEEGEEDAPSFRAVGLLRARIVVRLSDLGCARMGGNDSGHHAASKNKQFPAALRSLSITSTSPS